MAGTYDRNGERDTFMRNCTGRCAPGRHDPAGSIRTIRKAEEELLANLRAELVYEDQSWVFTGKDIMVGQTGGKSWMNYISWQGKASCRNDTMRWRKFGIRESEWTQPLPWMSVSYMMILWR